jgi:fucose 4-O-acetylase-like acetyltransferase
VVFPERSEISVARIAWIDRAKGWGMILVMAGHGALPFRSFLYFVPMPIFFFLSGYLYHEWKYKSVTQLVVARARRLLVPYFIFSILNSALWLAFHPSAFSHGWGAALWPQAYQILAWHRTEDDPYLGPYWFILCLFVTELLYFAVSRSGALLAIPLRVSPDRCRIVLVALITAAGFYYARHWGQSLPWSFDIAMIAVAFYGAGHFARGSYRFDLLFAKKWTLPTAIVGLLLGVLNSKTGSAGRVEMYADYYHNPLLFLIGAFSGLYLFLLVMRRIPDIRQVQLIGRESLTFLVLHYPIFLPMGAFIDKVFADPRWAAILPHWPILHSISLRILKGIAGLGITLAGLVVAYLIIAPLAVALRKHGAVLFGRKSYPAATPSAIVEA